MNSPTRYSFWLRNLHWLMAMLVIAALALGELHTLAPRGSVLRSNMMYWHMQFGIAVLLLLLPRLIARLSSKRPAIVPPVQKWQSLSARVMQVIFYVLMLLLPILGTLTVQASGHLTTFFGLSIPTLVGSDRALSHQFKQYHELAGNIFLWLVLAHAAIAWWHHWGRADNTLRRMLCK